MEEGRGKMEAKENSPASGGGPSVEQRTAHSRGVPTGAGFDHRRLSLTLEVEGTVTLAQPAGGVACPTKNENTNRHTIFALDGLWKGH